MKIVTLIPFFRENLPLTKACLENVATYADGAVVCVNDAYDTDLNDFLRSFSIVKMVAFVRKGDKVCDPIYLSSLLTMAQQLEPDWIVRQDIDEVFEPRFQNIREYLDVTPFNLLYVLWTSYVQDESHHCFAHHDLERGLIKPIIYRFALDNLYIPAQFVHADLTPINPFPGVLNIRLFHKNMLKSDQENFVKFIGTGRNQGDDPSVRDIEQSMPEVFEFGKDTTVETFHKKQKDTEKFMPFTFTQEPHRAENKIVATGLEQFSRDMLCDYLSVWYGEQNVRLRLAQERPTIETVEALRQKAVSFAKKSGWVRKLRAKYLKAKSDHR